MDEHATAPREEIVVLVHGLWMNRLLMWPLARRLRAARYTPYAFGYASALQSFDRHVAALAAYVMTLRGRVHFVGHSLGGVLVLQALQRLADQDIGRVVLLGAPLRGSIGAAQFMRHAFGRFCVGASGELWHSFPALRCEARVEVGVIAGTRRVGLGRFFTDLPGPNDGVVTVEETRIAGLADHIVLPLSHTGMLFARGTAEQTVQFLKTGKFRAGS